MAPALPVMRAETSVGRRFLGSSRAGILPASMCVSVVPKSKHNRGQKIRVQHLERRQVVRQRGVAHEQLARRRQRLDPGRKTRRIRPQCSVRAAPSRQNFKRSEQPGSSATGRRQWTARRRATPYPTTSVAYARLLSASVIVRGIAMVLRVGTARELLLG